MSVYNKFYFKKELAISSIRYPKIIFFNNKILLFGSTIFTHQNNVYKYLINYFELNDNFDIISKKNIIDLNLFIDNYFDNINISSWVRNITIKDSYLEFLIEIKTNIDNSEYKHKYLILKTNNLIDFIEVERINKYDDRFIFYINDKLLLASKILKTNEFWGKYLFNNIINNQEIEPIFDKYVSHSEDTGHLCHNVQLIDDYYEILFSIRKKIDNYLNYSNNLPYIYECYVAKTKDFINFYDTEKLKIGNFKTEFFSYPSIFTINNVLYLICNQDDFGKLKNPLIFSTSISKIKFLDLYKNIQPIEDEIMTEITKVIKTTSFIDGPQVKEFESNFAKYLDVKHCIGVANGTDAIEIAIKSLNLPENSEIITQCNTFYSTCSSIINNNCNLILVDIDPETYMIDVNKLENYITENTKVIIPVHLYGHSADMDKILEIAKKYNIYVIEDCAQAQGCLYKDKKVGCFGDIGCFSFYPGKNLGAFGDAGCIVTNNDNLNKKIRLIKNLGSEVKYNHEIIGRNSRLDTIQACVLNIKLKYLDENNKKRLQNYYLYKKYLSNKIEIQKIEDWCTPVLHLMIIRLKDKETRDKLKNYLLNNNIECGIHYPINIQNQEAFKNIVNQNNNFNDYSDSILSLPMYPELTENQIIYICDIINQYIIF
jgi:dTDP-4-amino-4,6-dideoxygalactose transaminase